MLACLRGKTRDQILSALPVGADQVVEGSRVQWGPIVDGLELPEQPRLLFEIGAFHRVPLVVGTNRDEGWPFVDRSFPAGLTATQYAAVLATEFGADAPAIGSLYPVASFSSAKEALATLVGDVEYVCEARRVARLVERTGTPVYRYSFEYEVDAVAQDLVIHGLESNLLFGNNFGPPTNYALTGPDLALFRFDERLLDAVRRNRQSECRRHRGGALAGHQASDRAGTRVGQAPRAGHDDP